MGVSGSAEEDLHKLRVALQRLEHLREAVTLILEASGSLIPS